MKQHLTIIGLLLILSSCNHVYFSEIQPKGGERQTEMPKELYGIWYGETEGWEFDENGFTEIDIITDSIGNVIDTTYKTIVLSDSLRLYKAKDLYVIHFKVNSDYSEIKDNSDYWEIVILKLMKNGDINAYYISDPKVFATAKGLKLEEANYYIDDELKSVDTLDPYAESVSAVYSGQMKLKTLRKVLASITPTTLKDDGSIFSVNDTIQ